MTTNDIWLTYNQDIKRFILSKIKDEQIANDLLQETFIKIHTKLHTLKSIDSVKSWVFSIAKFTVLDYFRTHKTLNEFPENNVVIEDETPVHDELDCLHSIIKNLPKKYRDPLFLSDIKGLKQAKVAEQLKLQLSTTKSRIQRARKLITKGYMDCCDLKINEEGFLTGEIKDKADCKVCS